MTKKYWSVTEVVEFFQVNETFLNDASGGWLATINYIGYMLGAMRGTDQRHILK